MLGAEEAVSRSQLRGKLRLEAVPSRCFKVKRCEGLCMAEAFYLRVTLEPHHKHSGSTTGGTILFLAEVPMALAKHSSSNPDDEAGLLREA